MSNASTWTFGQTNHVMVGWKMIIVLAKMRFMVGTNVCELHPIDEKSSMTSLRNKGLYFVYK